MVCRLRSKEGKKNQVQKPTFNPQIGYAGSTLLSDTINAVTKGSKTWIVIVHEDQLTEAVSVLRKARIEFVTSLGGLTMEGRDIVFDIDHSRYTEERVSAALVSLN